MVEYDFKHCVRWSKEEDQTVKDCFEKLRTNYKPRDNKFEYMRLELKKKGYTRTAKAVSRRFTKLGLKFYTTEDVMIPTQCMDCSEKMLVSNRYINRKTDKTKRCEDCQKVYEREKESKRRKTERARAYHRKYLKEWRKK